MFINTYIIVYKFNIDIMIYIYCTVVVVTQNKWKESQHFIDTLFKFNLKVN